jgi:acetylglutamate kinase
VTPVFRGGSAPERSRPVVLKLGGELVEDPARLAPLARAIARLGARTPLVVVHGGGREIDAALAEAGLPRRQVDGLRITDAPTLRVVVGVLAGTVNTRFVAAVNAAGGAAVGLTAADAGVAPVVRAARHAATDGTHVDLGLVGRPVPAPAPALLDTLTGRGFVPVVASIGATRRGEVLNVNADTLAGSLAARLGARRLVIAGGTSGVLDETGQTIPLVTRRSIRTLIRAGSASAGMVAKLRACEAALAGAVPDVVVADGRDLDALVRLALGTAPAAGTWTRLSADVRSAAAGRTWQASSTRSAGRATARLRGAR